MCALARSSRPVKSPHFYKKICYGLFHELNNPYAENTRRSNQAISCSAAGNHQASNRRNPAAERRNCSAKRAEAQNRMPSRLRLANSATKATTGKIKATTRKNIEIHDIVTLKPDNLPEGSILKDHQDYVVQDLIIGNWNTCYRQQRWQTPSGDEL